MTDFIAKHQHDDQISIYFNIEADEVMVIGEQMESIHDQAYMNGYNWEAFIHFYLQTNNPELLEGLDTDSEAGTYVGYYDKENGEKADRLLDTIKGLVNNPDKIYSFLRENGEAIEWD